MTTLRKILYYFTGFVTFLVLLQLPFAFAVSNVFSNPNNIDQVLEDGGAYKSFVDIALQNAKDQGDENTKKLLAEPKIEDAIKSSVQPSDIQSSSKSVIDGIYAWLEGKTAQPEFTIDLSKPAEQAVAKLSAYAEERSSGLPACTLQQLQTVDLQSDLLSIPCLPPGVTSGQIGQQFAQKAKEQVEFLQNPVITSKDALKETDLTSQEFTDAPKAYQNLHQSKWYNLVFALILILLLIFARRDRIAGIRFTAKLVLVAGVIIGITLLLFLAGKSQPTNIDNELGRVMVDSIVSLFGQIAMTVKWFAAGYIIIGIAGIFAARRLTPHQTLDAGGETPTTTK